MDDRVIAAMARWPNVPDVYGWLSLNAAGHWRLHPEGSAGADVCLEHGMDGAADGEPITSSKINQFINRNYAHDAHGQWFFQNGPQRVYVRLDVAPLVLHTIENQLDHPVFRTHNGLSTKQVTRWCLDDAGHLYADTDLGAGLVAGRDVEHVLNCLSMADGEDILHVLERAQAASEAQALEVHWADGSAAVLHVCDFVQASDLLGFVRHPRPRS